MKKHLFIATLFLVIVAKCFAQATDEQEKVTDFYKTDTECDGKKAVIGFQIYKEQIPTDLKRVLSIDEEDRNKQLYSLEYDMYLSVDFTADLLYTKKLAFRYKLQIDGTGTLDKWEYIEIDWEKDLKKIGKRYYLGKSWYGNLHYETMLECDTDPSVQKQNELSIALNKQKEETDTVHFTQKLDNSELYYPKGKYKIKTRSGNGKFKKSKYEITDFSKFNFNTIVNDNSKIGDIHSSQEGSYSEIVDVGLTKVINKKTYYNVIHFITKSEVISKIDNQKNIFESEAYFAKGVGIIYSKSTMDGKLVYENYLVNYEID